jgi:predicted nucleic acid-binding protein
MSNSTVVIDASLALAWVLSEPQPDWALQLQESAENALVDFLVPTAFWLEVGNILVRQRGMSHDQMLEGLIRVESLGIADVELDRPTRLRSLELAFQDGLTTYDAVYLALAVDLGAQLATLDAKLGAAASNRGLRYGDDAPVRARETHAAYDSGQRPDPVSLSVIGEYVARFRQGVA